MYTVTIKEAKSNKFKMNDFIRENDGLIRAVTKKYTCLDPQTQEDIYQVASLAFYKCLVAFDESLNIQFSTYVTSVMSRKILTYLRDDAQIKAYRAPRYIADYMRLKKEGKSDEDIARILKKEKRHIQNLSNLENTCYIEGITNRNNEGDTTSLLDTMASHDNTEESAILSDNMKNLTKTLTAKEKIIFDLFFIKEMNQVSISEAVGHSQAHVSRLLKSVKKKIKNEAV